MPEAGALVLAAAGLLEGEETTTHWWAQSYSVAARNFSQPQAVSPVPQFPQEVNMMPTFRTRFRTNCDDGRRIEVPHE